MKKDEQQEETFSKLVIHTHCTEEDFMPECYKNVLSIGAVGSNEGSAI